MNSPFLRKMAAVLLLAALIPAGCATTDSGKTKQGGTLTGAAVGSILGAVVGAVLGDEEGALLGAAIGGALGTAVGYTLGSSVASRKAKYANEEDRLNGEIAQVEKYNKELLVYHEQTRTRLWELDREIGEERAEIETGTLEKSKLKKKQTELEKVQADNEKHKKVYSEEYLALNDYLQSIKQAQNQNKVNDLELELALLKVNIEALDSNNQEIAQMMETLSVRK